MPLFSTVGRERLAISLHGLRGRTALRSKCFSGRLTHQVASSRPPHLSRDTWCLQTHGFRGSMAQTSLLPLGPLSEDNWAPTPSGLRLSLLHSLSIILLSVVSPPILFVHMLYSFTFLYCHFRGISVGSKDKFTLSISRFTGSRQCVFAPFL